MGPVRARRLHSARPQPNELLLAFVASDGSASGTQSATVSGVGLTWRIGAAHQCPTRYVPRSGRRRRSPLASNVTVTSTQVQSGYRQSLTVVAIQRHQRCRCVGWIQCNRWNSSRAANDHAFELTSIYGGRQRSQPSYRAGQRGPARLLPSIKSSRIPLLTRSGVQGTDDADRVGGHDQLRSVIRHPQEIGGIWWLSRIDVSGV